MGLSFMEIDGGLCIVLRDAASSADSVKASVCKGDNRILGFKA